jgi:integrase
MSQQRRTNRRNNPNGYPPPLPNETEVQFIEACGLRRSELLNLSVHDIRQDEEGRMWIHVAKSAGKSEREVPVLAGNEKRILAFLQNARLFPSLPEQVDVLLARKLYARILYSQLLRAKQELPSLDEYDQEAAREVMRALGHDRLDIVCHYFLHLRNTPADEVTTPGTEPKVLDQESPSSVNDQSATISSPCL